MNRESGKAKACDRESLARRKNFVPETKDIMHE